MWCSVFGKFVVLGSSGEEQNGSQGFYGRAELCFAAYSVAVR